MNIEIVEAMPGDASEICYVHKLVWLSTYPNQEIGITEDDIKTLKLDGSERVAIRTRFLQDQSGDNKTYIAMYGHKIIGFCVGSKTATNNLIRSLYVLPDFQGRGIGRKLLLTIIEWLGSGKDIVLGVASYNKKAQDFYLKLGFTHTGEVKEFITKPNGKSIPELVMLKPMVNNMEGV